MYSTVYIKESNRNGFSQLIMNNLASNNVKFNNLDINKEKIFYQNVLIYIPKNGISKLSDEDLIIELGKVRSFLCKFKTKVILTSNCDDCRLLQNYINSIGSRNNTNYYQALAYDTLYASIVVEDIVDYIRKRRK